MYRASRQILFMCLAGDVVAAGDGVDILVVHDLQVPPPCFENKQS